jgi:hypothetical protein
MKLPYAESIVNRFWLKVDKKSPYACWEWRGALRNGYGNLAKGSRGSGTEYAHRISWQIHNGSIPPRLCVLHICDNRKCVNPFHLFLGTKKDNTQDMISKSRTNGPAGERNHKAKLKSSDVKKIRQLFSLGITRDELQSIYPIIDRSSLNAILRMATWKHLI